MEDPIPISLEAGAVRVGLLRATAMPRAACPSGDRCKDLVLELLACNAVLASRPDERQGGGVRGDDTVRLMVPRRALEPGCRVGAAHGASGLRATAKGPNPWSVGIREIVLMLTWGGREATKRTTSATSSGPSGCMPW